MVALAALILIPPLLAGCGRTLSLPVVPAHLGVDETQEKRVATDPAALARIAEASARSGDRTAAAAFYGRAAALAPNRPDYAIGQARALSEEGQVGVAIGVLQDARRNNPDSEVVAGTLGKLLVVSHRPADAVEVFRQTLARRPRSPLLLVGLGVALDAEGLGSAAQAAYRQALAIDPGSIAAANDLALSMALDGQLDAAVADLRSLRARVAAEGGSEASLATIDGNLALVYGMRGDMTDAAQSASRAASPAELGGNLRFYSALGPAAGAAGGAGAAAGADAPPPVIGAPDSSGLPDPLAAGASPAGAAPAAGVP